MDPPLITEATCDSDHISQSYRSLSLDGHMTQSRPIGVTPGQLVELLPPGEGSLPGKRISTEKGRCAVTSFEFLDVAMPESFLFLDVLGV